MYVLGISQLSIKDGERNRSPDPDRVEALRFVIIIVMDGSKSYPQLRGARGHVGLYVLTAKLKKLFKGGRLVIPGEKQLADRDAQHASGAGLRSPATKWGSKSFRATSQRTMEKSHYSLGESTPFGILY